MDIIAESKKELESKHVAYTEFILDFKKNKENLYCFYEGKDDRHYYSIRVRLNQPEHDIHHYTCNGKANVISVQKLISLNKIYSESSIFYFIDKDFDINNYDSNIYITPTYSIENFFTVDEAFKNILLEEYQIPKTTKTFNEALMLYNLTKKAFHKKVSVLNAFLSCQADFRYINKCTNRLQIDKSLRTFFSHDIFENCINENFQIKLPNEILSKIELDKIFKDAPFIENKDLNAKILFHEKQNQDELFRGKFEIKFLISFLKRFQNEITKKNGGKFSSQHTTTLRFENSTSISQLAKNAMTPSCLLQYLKKYNESEKVA